MLRPNQVTLFFLLAFFSIAMGVIEERKKRSPRCGYIGICSRNSRCSSGVCRREGKCPRNYGCCDPPPCHPYCNKKRLFDTIEMGPNMEIDNFQSGRKRYSKKECCCKKKTKPKPKPNPFCHRFKRCQACRNRVCKTDRHCGRGGVCSHWTQEIHLCQPQRSRFVQ